MAAMPPPVVPDLVLRELVRPTAPQAGRTLLSAHDLQTATAATCRAWAVKGARLSLAALRRGLQRTLDDLPFLAGRLGGAHLVSMHLGDLCIEHTGDGVLLTAADAPEASVDCMAPHTWPVRGRPIADPAVPFYIEPLDLGRRLLAGQEPLMRVRLTRLGDGDILAVTLAHLVTDGVRWPALASHLAARYRQAAAERQPGAAPQLPEDAAQLLHPGDRRRLSLEHMAAELLGPGVSWEQRPPPPRVRWSPLGAWRLARLVLADARQPMDLVMLHLPQGQVAALKQAAAAGNPAVTTGDAVQAAAALLLHAALGRPLLPVAPYAMVVLVQLPTPAGYFGNAVHMLRVQLPVGSGQPAELDGAGALRQLAGAIRRHTAAFRSKPEEALRALQDAEALTAAPVSHMLTWLAGHRMPLLTCTTNYVPTQQGIDLGLGQPAYSQGMTMPRARDMALIRPAVCPYSDGLFLQLLLAPAQAAALRRLPLLRALLPQARFVGDD